MIQPKNTGLLAVLAAKHRKNISEQNKLIECPATQHLRNILRNDFLPKEELIECRV